MYLIHLFENRAENLNFITKAGTIRSVNFDIDNKKIQHHAEEIRNHKCKK